MLSTLRRAVHAFQHPPEESPGVTRDPDVTPEEWATWEAVRNCTMTSFARVLATIRAAEHVARTGIAGDLVECGVWRGGNTMAMTLTLLRLGEPRDVWLFDTFTGMTPATDRDRDYTGERASALLDSRPRDSDVWAIASLTDVKQNLASTGYPSERLHFVEGAVESTVPASAPDRIAMLRLDTDWYESTAHELKHLYPRLAPGGILIVDDYGHWSGARQAVDEYFAGRRPFLHRIDYTGRLLVKS